jgi:hypothetical protein
MNNFILGADPEFFAYNKNNNKFVSLVPYLKGTKKRPQPIDMELISGCFKLKDNVSVEFNMPPVTEYWMLKALIDYCIEDTNKWLQNIDPNLELAITSSAEFDNEELSSKEAQEFGCDPAYSVYSEGVVYRPSPNEIGALRTASYHIHYGWDTEYTREELFKFIVLNDIFLGVPATFKDLSDKSRKIAYGSLSEHRIKSKIKDYFKIKKANRIEYRSLGAGIHNYPGFVDNGIKMIREHVHQLDDIYDKYFDDLYFLQHDLYNEKLLTSLKKKLETNGHWNNK